MSSLHIMVLVLGFTGIFGKLITLEAIHLVWYRMLIAFITLAIFLVFKNQLFSIKRKDFLGIVGVGVLVTLHWLCFFHSIKVSNVSVAVVCLATSSLFAAILEPILFKRKLLRYEVIMSLVVIAALIYILGAESKYVTGYVFGLIAAFLGTLFTIFNAKYIGKIDAAKITMIEMLTGIFIISCLFLCNQDYSLFTSFISMSDFCYLLILGTVCTAGVFVWMTEIMKHITPYSLIMAINLEPIYSILLALLIFGDAEKMSPSFYIGGSVIIAVVSLEGVLKNKQ
ncbi:MAG: DMT family transporter [Bacteroidota bacterium]|nr:DMT family transporter [Bacteroidota bacterium]